MSKIVTGFEVVTIPDYLVKALEEKGMSLQIFGDKLATIINPVTAKNKILKQETINSLFSWFRENMSQSDIKDLFIANDFVDGMLYGTNNSSSAFDKSNNHSSLNEHLNFTFSSLIKTAMGYTITEDHADFINFMSNQDIDLNSIIVNNTANEVVEFKVTQNVLFVVIKSGFMNVTRFKNSNFARYFKELTLNSLFKAYGEDSIKAHPLFMSFLRLAVRAKSL